MSRDFTPLERYLSNKLSGDDLWLQNITITYKGETKPLYTEDEQAVRLRFRNLAVAMCDSFMKLYKYLEGDKNRNLWIIKLENMQVKMQNAFKKGQKAFEECDVPEIMKKWFVGKLDPCFHYSETNDEMYLDWCKETIEKWRNENETLP